MTYTKELTPAEKGAATKAIRAKTASKEKTGRFDKLFTMGSASKLDEENPVGLTISGFKTIEEPSGLKVSMTKVMPSRLHKNGEDFEPDGEVKIAGFDKEATYLYEEKTPEEMTKIVSDPEMQQARGGVGFYDKAGRENLQKAKKKIREERRAQLAARA